MSKSREIITFILQSVTAGLALAFLVLYLWPQISGENQSSGGEEGTQNPQQPASYSHAVDRAAPAVVSIYTISMHRPDNSQGSVRNLQLFSMSQDMGSGVLLTSDGYILTNFHVINRVQNIRVSLWDGRVTSARVVGTDRVSDLAVLKVDLDGLPVAPVAENSEVRVGDVALAIGNALGWSHTVTLGIISATGRDDQRSGPFSNFIQTDAAINPGSSGGALINAHGDLIGINTRSQDLNRDGAQNIGFAIPIGQALDVMEQIIESGTVQRSWLGAAFMDGRYYRLEDGSGERRGVLVGDVERNGPAWEAGIRAGDVVLMVDGKEMTDATLLNLDIARRKPGETVELLVSRRGGTFQTYAQLRQLPPLY